jgi:predicted DNA-binding protein YlxM (UPF0122 family)
VIEHDEEFRALGWAAAEQRGARQQRPLASYTDVRLAKMRADDPLGLDTDDPLADDPHVAQLRRERAARDAEVRSSFGIWRKLQIDDPPPDNVQLAQWWSTLSEERQQAIVATMYQLADALVKPVAEIFETMQQTIAAMMRPTFEWLRDLAAELQLVEVEPLERRRHGHASMCPRHGPTTGGLCRRCARGQ